jgi:hypothetical protein
MVAYLDGLAAGIVVWMVVFIASCILSVYLLRSSSALSSSCCSGSSLASRSRRVRSQSALFY